MASMVRSLRNRFLLSLCGVLCLALLALLIIERYQIKPILLAEEESFAAGKLDRAERALASELNHMRRLVEDWAYWDDTYDFVLGERAHYVDSNLYEATLETLDLEMMIFLDADSEPYWVTGFDSDGDYTSCPGTMPPCDWAVEVVDFLSGHLAQGVEGLTQTWLLAHPELALGAIAPIHQSRAESPAGGWLVMKRPLTDSWIEQLRQTTGIELSLSPALADSGGDLQLERLSPTLMTASRVAPALPPNRAVRIDAQLPRERYQASLETFRFALYWTTGVLIATLLVVLWLLERMVLLPLRRFSQYTQRLKQEAGRGEIPASLVQRSDEIGTLAREFRSLLAHQRRQSEQLLELTLHDPLTGVANRRLFDQRFVEVLRPPGAHHSVVAMMIDIDHFKLYNDHYGHQAGDDCLVALARCMEECLDCRGILLARTGGEEFSVLLPDTSLEAALMHARRLLAAINTLHVPHAFSPTAPHVTVSIGVAAWHKSLPTASDIMRAADKAMYLAKANGRNRVEIYQLQGQSSPIEQ